MAERVTVYVILGSHACRTGTLMLEHKGVPFRAVRLPTILHGPAVRMLGFPGPTVPAVRAGDRLVQTNRAIARWLEEVRPEPPLFPADPERRRAVEEAERWADEVFQMAARRTAFAAALHGRDAFVERGSHGPLGPLLWRGSWPRLVNARLVGRLAFRVDAAAERRLLAELPAMLDRIDGWIADGVIGGERPNAADFAIATSVALLAYRRDLRDEIAARPAGALAERLVSQPARAAA